MVKIIKSKKPDKNIKRKSDYQKGIVFATICNDFYHKCYICEDKPSSVDVEHIITHKNDPALQFDWNNLFYACTHCNRLKNNQMFYNGIFNPTEKDPEKYIEISMPYDNLKEKVKIVAIKKIEEGDLVDNTIKLLNLVYNSSDTSAKNKSNKGESSFNLKNNISENLTLFWIYVESYYENYENGDYYNIIEQITREAKFAGFKRHIVRNTPILLNDFGKYLDD